ncbi:MAG: ADP-ribosylglycohydrolase family protein [Steroidobacteraceae bacterium]
MNRPLANSYWLQHGRILAGEYPTGREAKLTAEGHARLQSLVSAGIDCFIDLTEVGEGPAYDALLPKGVMYLRHAIRDQDVPRRQSQMRRIQDDIDAALASGRTLYLHCRAGIGRTGLTAGCFLVEQGHDGEAALRELNLLWTQQCARAASWPTVPQTPQQAEYVRGWRARRPAAIAAASAGAAAEVAVSVAAAPAAGKASEAELAPVRNLRERFQGALQGLAIGDALAAATQYRRPGSFPAVGDLLGGGPFELPRGAWSDDTAMALCLAESLAETGSCNARDQVTRYSRWQREGYLSATGQCLGITASTAQALASAQWRQQPYAGSHDPQQLHPEALSRVAPVVLHAFADPAQAVELAADVARTTSQAPLVLDACRLLAAMLHAALSGAARAQVLSPPASVFAARALRPQVAAIGAAKCLDGAPPADANGDVLAVLTLARWAFGNTTNFRDGALRAVNLGGHSDVIGAVYGQLAGAYYGLSGVPRGWREALVHAEQIAQLADRLLRDALLQLGEGVGVS